VRDLIITQVLPLTSDLIMLTELLKTLTPISTLLYC